MKNTILVIALLLAPALTHANRGFGGMDANTDATIRSATASSSMTASAFFGDGSHLTDVVAASVPNTVTSSQTFTNGLQTNSLRFGAGGVSFSSAPVGHVCGAAVVGSLASGTTFLTFVPDAPVTLRRVTFDVVVAGIAGSGDTITCNNAAGTGISVTVGAAAAAGTVATGVGTANIAYQATVSCHIESAAATRPIGNVCLEYVGQ